MSTHNRPARVAEEFRQELSAILARGLKDPRISGFVTVTGAKMSPDLREATAYVSVHADEKVRERTMEGLHAAAPFLQREVARTLALRYTPHLRFVYDESVARGDRIDRLLREARAQDREAAAARGEGAVVAQVAEVSTPAREPEGERQRTGTQGGPREDEP